jgi:diphosphate-dependent phosphofructokinase
MGRSASHITLECALHCRPTYAFIGEEVQAKNLSLKAITDILIGIIQQRDSKGKNYGIILVPEGLIEFIPEMNRLIQEINQILSEQESLETIEALSACVA